LLAPPTAAPMGIGSPPMLYDPNIVAVETDEPFSSETCDKCCIPTWDCHMMQCKPVLYSEKATYYIRKKEGQDSVSSA
jgi:hypothetical protein